MTCLSCQRKNANHSASQNKSMRALQILIDSLSFKITAQQDDTDPEKDLTNFDIAVLDNLSFSYTEDPRGVHIRELNVTLVFAGDQWRKFYGGIAIDELRIFLLLLHKMVTAAEDIEPRGDTLEISDQIALMYMFGLALRGAELCGEEISQDYFSSIQVALRSFDAKKIARIPIHPCLKKNN